MPGIAPSQNARRRFAASGACRWKGQLVLGADLNLSELVRRPTGLSENIADRGGDAVAEPFSLQIFTFNVPRSVHRGVEVAADWRPLPGWRLIAAYTYLDQFYVDYTEQLSTGALAGRFDRGGNKIPGHLPERAVHAAGL